MVLGIMRGMEFFGAKQREFSSWHAFNIFINSDLIRVIPFCPYYLRVNCMFVNIRILMYDNFQEVHRSGLILVKTEPIRLNCGIYKLNNACIR